MIEYLPQALASLSTALNIAKSLVEIRDSAKLQEAVIQFNTAIIDPNLKSSLPKMNNLRLRIR